MALSRMVLVRRNYPDRRVQDIPGEIRKELSAAGFSAKVRPGSRVAIGVGSRGIANLATIVRAVVDYWKAQGMQPIVFPAMGSHGAATAEGQAKVLAHYGIHADSMGCPVVSSLEVVPLGRTAQGIEAFMDRSAYESDGVMLVNRVKWHTDFAGELESGLFKMMAIGLGKFAGAQRYHTFGFRMGLEQVIRSVGRQVLTSGKILGGLAILEDAHHNTARVEAVPVETMERREEELLEMVKSWAGRIPVEELDILIVDEIGKDISGAGMDTKVINRSIHAEYNPWPNAPRIQRIFARDLSALSYNNAVGLGLADVVTDRLVNRIDWTPTHINSLTASTPEAIRTPIHFPTDRECLERISTTVGKFDPAEVTIGWIRNTMELALLALSENLLPEIRRNPNLEVLGEPRELDYDAEGNLVSPLLEALARAH
ncbi:MAG: hypothetical protein ABSH05_15325 [Bryobacteraceae bacterium]|jgi:hypothetical protein